MGTQVYQTTVTVTAGVAKTAPTQTSIAIPPQNVTRVRIRVPPGPKGEVGFMLTSNGTRVIPQTAGEWIVTDNEVLNWEVDGWNTSGQWELTWYNTGLYAHQIQVMLVAELVDATAVGQATVQIDPAALSSP